MNIFQKHAPPFKLNQPIWRTPTILFCLVAGCISICLALLPPLLSWHDREHDPLNKGDHLIDKSRGLLAEYSFHKAMDYFHSGALPSMLNPVSLSDENPVPGAKAGKSASTNEQQPDQSPFLDPPLDFLDRFGRNFIPTHDTHLNQGGAAGHGENLVREMLPWLWLAVELDPHYVGSYLEAAYWLRRTCGYKREAIAFLREGLKANPTSYEILYELGCCHDEDWSNPNLARNLWEVALHGWENKNNHLAKPDEFAFRQITGHLARLEEGQGRFKQALVYLEMLKRYSPNGPAIDRWMKELWQREDMQTISTQ